MQYRKIARKIAIQRTRPNRPNRGWFGSYIAVLLSWRINEHTRSLAENYGLKLKTWKKGASCFFSFISFRYPSTVWCFWSGVHVYSTPAVNLFVSFFISNRLDILIDTHSCNTFMAPLLCIFVLIIYTNTKNQLFSSLFQL